MNILGILNESRGKLKRHVSKSNNLQTYYDNDKMSSVTIVRLQGDDLFLIELFGQFKPNLVAIIIMEYNAIKYTVNIIFHDFRINSRYR